MKDLLSLVLLFVFTSHKAVLLLQQMSHWNSQRKSNLVKCYHRSGHSVLIASQLKIKLMAA